MKRSAVLLAIALATTSPARAWGPEGHSVVAMLAEAQMSDGAKKAFREILFGAPLVTASIMADEYRQSHLETSRWHYVDIPYDETAYDPARDCKLQVTGDCVLAAIGREEAILLDPKAKPFDRADALKRLVHWIGDVHQPFHAIERNQDEGGNKVNVTFFDDKKANLHSVWDSGLILKSGLTAEEYVSHLQKDILPTLADIDLKQADPTVWAMSSHDAAKGAYVNTGEVLGQPYYDTQIITVDRQLALAGVHLAATLESLAPRALTAYRQAQQDGF
jgi:hypothetical protein